MDEKQIKKTRLLLNIIIALIILAMATIKHLVLDKNEIEKQIQKNKQILLIHTKHIYDRDMKKIFTFIDKKIKFFSDNLNTLAISDKINADMNNKIKRKKLTMHYNMLKDAMSTLQYIAIYDNNLKLLHTSKKYHIQDMKDRDMLQKPLAKKNKNQVSYILKKEHNKVLLIATMQIQKDNISKGIMEIVVDISYLKKEILDIYSKEKLQNTTFDILLWSNKIGYDNVLEKNIQILNYKVYRPFRYSNLIPIFAIFLVVMLINLLYSYFIRLLIIRETKARHILDIQSNLTVIFTKNEIIGCNKSFINLLDFQNEKDLILNHKHINDFFIAKEEFEISMQKDIFWADYLIKTDNDFAEILLKDRHGNKIGIFDVSISSYQEDKIYYIASFRNIDSLYKSKQALLLEQEKSKSIINNSSDGFIDLDTKTGEIYTSKRLMEILGYGLDEIEESVSSYSKLVHQEDSQKISNKIEEAYNNKDYFSQCEIRLLNKKKIWIWVYARIKIIKGDDYHHTRIILFFTDIDEQKKQTLLMKNTIKKELEKNKQQEVLLSHQSKLASMGEMMGSIAHQWRQPLNELGIRVQNLKFNYKKGLIDKEFIDNFISQNKKTIMFMSKTIDDFRSFYKTDKEKKYFSILNAIQFCIDMQSALLKNSNININIDGEDFEHNGLEGEFKQVILNLMSNTKDAFEVIDIQDKKIDISIKDKKILFSDNAGGIPKDIIQKIFEPYFTTKEQGKGTGIGLHMSKSIIENNSGVLSVENSDGGVCFVIDFSKKERK